MWLKSHHWVDVPYTRTERKKVLNVRESKHTIMLFDMKYYDVETGKYKTDKLPTLYHSSLAELVVNDSSETGYHNYLDRCRKEEAWFVPKDDDFDDDCRREEEEKRRHKERQRIAKEKKRLDEEFEANKKKRIAYDIQLAEAEKRVNNNKIYLGGINHGKPCESTNNLNVRPNKWIIK